ncbi:MAG TPA: M17 family peptidase N-terminal domain-containing protein, partial [Planctomycetota bacterium]|nr:M17 family peptidase N-terminal domain-containing protein [Planctomycetota bacterium]
MQVTTKTGAATAAKTDLLVLLIRADSEAASKGAKKARRATSTLSFPPGFEDSGAAALEAGDLPTQFRSKCILYPSGKANAKRLLLIAVGNDVTTEKLRQCAAIAVQHAIQVKAPGCVLALADGVLESCATLGDEASGRALGEGVVLGAYKYDAPSGKKKEAAPTKTVVVMGEAHDLPKAMQKGVADGALRGASTCFARDLGNRAGNLLTPKGLAAEAKKLAGGSIRFLALGEARMKALGMGALLSVSRGSSEEAQLIVLEYEPKASGKAAGAKASKASSKRDTVLVVGKGLTFDAGGISIKPAAGMDEMRYDMCGGAAVLGLFHAIKSGAVTPKQRVVGVVPASENLLDGMASKPGDIVTACNGTTIEVLNTDAEGRLILCDALAWAIRTYKPSACVDLATLTGAVIVALGHEVTGAMGNDQALIDEVIAAGDRADDRCWQLPL